MNYKTFWMLLSILSLVIISAACDDKVTVNPNDSSAPVIELQLLGPDDRYADAPAEKNFTKSEALDISCVANDPQGLKSAEVTFSRVGLTQCVIRDVVGSDNYTIHGIPADKSRIMKPDAKGKVPTQAILLRDIQGPLLCSGLDTGGRPSRIISHTFTVTCKGENWASDPANSKAEKSMTVHYTNKFE